MFWVMNQNSKLAGGSDLPPNPTSICAHSSLSLRLHFGPLTNTDHSALLCTVINTCPQGRWWQKSSCDWGHNSVKMYFAISLRNSVPKLKQSRLYIFFLWCGNFNWLSVFPLSGYLKWKKIFPKFCLLLTQFIELCIRLCNQTSGCVSHGLEG